jgi:aryl-alcohol dehydrogenase-like predicted oxidoreductase
MERKERGIAVPFAETIREFYVRVGEKSAPLGIGCAWIGGATDAETLKTYLATLETAYERGFRCFDTSAMYGGSEFRVGKFLQRIDRKSVFLATKAHIPAAYRPDEAAQ